MKKRLVFWLTLLLGVATIVIGTLNTLRGLEGKDAFGLLQVITLSALLVLLLIYQKLRRNQQRRQEIRELRERGLSMRAIAAEVGCSVGTVHNALKDLA